jgi:hypothetical protein
LILGIALGISVASGCGDDELETRRRESVRCLAGTSDLFERRIRPLLETDQPKTCNQCHLSGVDLGLFVRPTMCETRACLLGRGLVDPSNVERSLVLSWISRAKPESELITQQVISEEYEGFRAFLESLLNCDATSCDGVVCSNEGGPSGCARDSEPTEPALSEGTDCSPVAIEQAFQSSVYAWRDRCYPCHHSDQLLADLAAPRWVEVYGGCNAGAATTLRNVIDSGYMNLGDPPRSLLLLKPLEAEGVDHGGGQKFHDTLDPAYISFLSFIEYYARCSSPD